jgi:glutamate racemase
MELVSSKDQKLSYNQVLLGSLVNMKEMGRIKENVPLKQAAESVVKEITNKSVDTIQIGNTLFSAIKGKDKSKNKRFGRVYNMDVGKNFIRNSYKYLSHLQKQGVTHYSTILHGDKLFPAMRVLHSKLKPHGSGLFVTKVKKRPDNYGLFIKIGEKPLPMENV